jgi:hypothetical protein
MVYHFGGPRHQYEEIGAGGTDGRPWRLHWRLQHTLVVTTVVVLLVLTLMVAGTGLLSSAAGYRPSSSSSSNTLPLLGASVVTAGARDRLIVEAPAMSAPTSTEEETVQEDFSKETYAKRYRRCKDVDWQQACDRLEGAAGARRRLLVEDEEEETFSVLEEEYLLDADDFSASYDEKCLRVYRLDLFGTTTFPYHANQLLRAGGNQTMALFIQHGAMRDADRYFCSFRKLMLEQEYRPFKDILVIAPSFNYERDTDTISTDAFWNGSKPWSDWRVGAESDPTCCGGIQTGTISSFSVLDHMLGILTENKLYPNLNKIAYVGHSAGGANGTKICLSQHTGC